MPELAKFTPVINELQQRAKDYYSERQIEIPKDDYFRGYFDFSTESKPIEEISGRQIFDAKKFFEKPTKSTYILDQGSEKIGTPISKQITIGAKGSIADRHNNPGNLMYANQPGATKGEPKKGGGFWAMFPNTTIGQNALIAQVELDQGRGATVAGFINKYAPPSENTTKKYISSFKKQFGVPADTKLSSLDPTAIAKFMAKKESSTII